MCSCMAANVLFTLPAAQGVLPPRGLFFLSRMSVDALSLFFSGAMRRAPACLQYAPHCTFSLPPSADAIDVSVRRRLSTNRALQNEGPCERGV